MLECVWKNKRRSFGSKQPKRNTHNSSISSTKFLTFPELYHKPLNMNERHGWVVLTIGLPANLKWWTMSQRASKNYRVGIGQGEVPPDDGAIGSAGVERRRLTQHSGGRDSVRGRRARPYGRHGSALHDTVSRYESGLRIRGNSISELDVSVTRR